MKCVPTLFAICACRHHTNHITQSKSFGLFGATFSSRTNTPV
jgi:hypothetical protein